MLILEEERPDAFDSEGVRAVVVAADVVFVVLRGWENDMVSGQCGVGICSGLGLISFVDPSSCTVSANR